MKVFGTLVKSPLLHFFIIGLILFVVYERLNPEALSNENKIIVSAGQIQYISNRFKKSRNRTPSSEELKAIIDEYVLTEIFYLEGQKLGLDKNDPMIKRRVRQKYEFISNDIISLMEVEDQQLQQYLENNKEKFKQDAIFSFEQIYINPNKHPDNLEAHLTKVHKQLIETNLAKSDSLMLPRVYANLSSTQINTELGGNIAVKFEQLKLAQWSKALTSGLGIHFVKLTNQIPAKTPDFENIRELILREYLVDKQKKTMKQQRLEILSNYEIIIDKSLKLNP